MVDSKELTLSSLASQEFFKFVIKAFVFYLFDCVLAISRTIYWLSIGLGPFLFRCKSLGLNKQPVTAEFHYSFPVIKLDKIDRNWKTVSQIQLSSETCPQTK